MGNLIARFFELVLLFLGLHRRNPPVREVEPRPVSLPVAAGPRHLLVYRSAMPAGLTPRPPDGPYSQAAYDRWERAENRFRAAVAARAVTGDARHQREPSPRPGGEGAARNSEQWDGPDFPAHRSPLTYPPCECGAAGCPDRPKRPGQDQARETRLLVGPDSPVLQDLRARVRDENDRRRKFGRLG